MDTTVDCGVVKVERVVCPGRVNTDPGTVIVVVLLVTVVKVDPGIVFTERIVVINTDPGTVTVLTTLGRVTVLPGAVTIAVVA